MPRLTGQPWQVLECIFAKVGYLFDRQNGSHRIYTKHGTFRPLVIPAYDAVDRDIITSLCKTAQMTRETFFLLLEQCR